MIDICSRCDNEAAIARQRDVICSVCLKKEYAQRQISKQRESRSDRKFQKNNAKPIKAVSVKKQRELRKYRKIKSEFLSKPENKTCAVTGCNNPAGVHHKKGRVGFADDWARNNDVTLLIDVRFFLPACDPHNEEFERRPNWARENGYSLSRLTDETN